MIKKLEVVSTGSGHFHNFGNETLFTEFDILPWGNDLLLLHNYGPLRTQATHFTIQHLYKHVLS